jgi:hypothetical protein
VIGGVIGGLLLVALLALVVVLMARRRRQESDDDSTTSKMPGSKYKATGGEGNSDPSSMAYITMSTDPAAGSKEHNSGIAQAQAALGRVGSPKAQAAGQAKPAGGAAPARSRPATIVLPKSAAALLDAIDVRSGMTATPAGPAAAAAGGEGGAGATATRSGPKTRAQQLALIEAELREIRAHLQVEHPAADGGQKVFEEGTQQGSGGQSSSLSSGDEMGGSSTGSDWIQAGAALTDHIPGLMLSAVLG